MNTVQKTNLSIIKIFSFLIILISLLSVDSWSKLPLGNTIIHWILSTLTLFFCYLCKKKFYNPIYKKNIPYITYYLIWIIICIIRGVFTANNYWEWKFLIGAIFGLLLPFLVYAFSIPFVLQKVFRYWIIIALPCFVFIALFITKDAYGFYLAPLLVLLIFLPTYNLKWKIIFVILGILAMTADLGARSNAIKFAVSFLLLFLYYFRHLIPVKVFKYAQISFFIIPFIFLFLGISGIFNIFSMDDYWGSHETRKVTSDGVITEDLAADTRTFIYIEVIESALKHHYVIQGRTPARGNDSMSFGLMMGDDLKTGKYERFANEVGILNVFTWTGIIGVILYSLIFFRASFLAIYHSNNIYVKLIGLFVAFRWMYSWVEDHFNFRIMSFTLWIMISICFSESFRRMNNSEFRIWAKGITSSFKARVPNKYK